MQIFYTALVVGVPASSRDVPDETIVCLRETSGRIYTQFMDYSNWNPTFNGYAYNYAVSVPADYNPNQAYPLSIVPHAHSEVTWSNRLVPPC